MPGDVNDAEEHAGQEQLAGGRQEGPPVSGALTRVPDERSLQATVEILKVSELKHMQDALTLQGRLQQLEMDFGRLSHLLVSLCNLFQVGTDGNDVDFLEDRTVHDWRLAQELRWASERCGLAPGRSHEEKIDAFDD